MNVKTIIAKLEAGIQPIVRITTDSFEEFELYDNNFIVKVIGFNHYDVETKELVCIIPKEWLSYNKSIAKLHPYLDGSYKTFDFEKADQTKSLYVDITDTTSFSEVNVASSFLFSEWENNKNGLTYIEFLENKIMNK